jgi:hypothetical protein
MDNFIPLNGSSELQEEAVKQIANLPESPLCELRFEWEKDVYLVIVNGPFAVDLIRITISLKEKNEWVRYTVISREMLEGVAIIQEEIDFAKKESE